MKLTNGAEILNIFLVADDDEQTWKGYVLAQLDHSESAHAFVTWFVYGQNSEQLSTSSGNYFNYYEAAQRDFWSRAITAYGLDENLSVR